MVAASFLFINEETIECNAWLLDFTEDAQTLKRTSIHSSFHLFVYICKHICISNDRWKLYWLVGTSSS